MKNNAFTLIEFIVIIGIISILALIILPVISGKIVTQPPDQTHPSEVWRIERNENGGVVSEERLQ